MVRQCLMATRVNLVKPVSLNQLLFHDKCDALSFYQAPNATDIDIFLGDMQSQLEIQGKEQLSSILIKHGPQIKKILKTHPEKSHGFFLSEHQVGYSILESAVESYCVIGTTFHIRPILEELFTNPEFMVVNISLYDIKVYRGDFHHLEIIQHYEFDQLPSKGGGFYTPQYLGLLPYKTLLALKTLAHKIQDMVLYHSLPVIVTGLSGVKEIFLRYFNHSAGVITQVHEDFYEKSCLQVLKGCKAYRPLVLDFYSAQLKDRLKRMTKSKRLLTDLDLIIKAISKGSVLHLVLPTESKLWGSLDLASGEFEIHEKIKNNSSIDILNELAEEVMRQGGRIQFLRPHFFPQDALVLAIVKGQV